MSWIDMRCNLHHICNRGPKAGCIFTDYNDGTPMNVLGVRNIGCEMPLELILSNMRVD